MLIAGLLGAQQPAPPSRPPFSLGFCPSPLPAAGCDAVGFSSRLNLPASPFLWGFISPPLRTRDPPGGAGGELEQFGPRGAGLGLFALTWRLRGRRLGAFAGAFRPLCVVSGHPLHKGENLLLGAEPFWSRAQSRSPCGTQVAFRYQGDRKSPFLPGEGVRLTAWGFASLRGQKGREILSLESFLIFKRWGGGEEKEKKKERSSLLEAKTLLSSTPESKERLHLLLPCSEAEESQTPVTARLPAAHGKSPGRSAPSLLLLLLLGQRRVLPGGAAGALGIGPTGSAGVPLGRGCFFWCF